MNISPKTPENRRLAMGVKHGDLEAVEKALADGADPNTYWDSGYVFLSTYAASQASLEGNGPGSTIDRILERLIAAGADPLAEREAASPHLASVAGHNASLRHHRLVGDNLIARARKAWAKGGQLSEPSARFWAKALNTDHRVDEALRQVLLTRGDLLPPMEWWTIAMQSRGTTLVDFCNKHFPGELTPSMAVNLIKAQGYGIRNGTPAVHWAAGLDPMARANFYLGIQGQPGVLAIGGVRVGAVAETLWKSAMADEFVMAQMARRGLVKAHVVLAALHLEADSILGMMEAASSLGVDLTQVRRRDASDTFTTLPADTWTGKEEDNLLETYLARRGQVAVKPIRAMERAGITPGFTALCRLCKAMTYSTTERKFQGLYQKWVQGGIDPNPGDTPAAWTFARKGPAERLEARWREERLESTLPSGDAARSPGRAGPRL